MRASLSFRYPMSTMETADTAISKTKPAARNAALKRRALLAVRVVVSAALIYLILRDADLRAVFEAIGESNLALVLLAFVLTMLGAVVGTLRWRALLAAQGVRAPLGKLLQSYMTGLFFNQILPSTIGGDASRAYDSWRIGGTKTGAVTVVFVDRFLGMLMLLAIAAVSLLLSSSLTSVLPFSRVWIVAGVLGMVGVVWLLFLPPRAFTRWLAEGRVPFAARIRTLTEALGLFHGRKDTLAVALLYSFVIQANVIVIYTLIAASLNLPVPLFDLLLIVPLAAMVLVLPISINGIGVREGVFAFFMAPFGVTTTEAVAYAWIAYAILVAQGLLGGVVYAFRNMESQGEEALAEARDA
jgi:uncharacterized protein (TIRG00374 family)